MRRAANGIMLNIIVGTAGHIDHGKTALVRALTGIETDRLKEEKQRGISIDLGFAHLQIGSDLRLGFIDVPGHERFVRNMLAGAGGIDLVLLVVAADESIKPQTREHFEICRLLGVRHGVIVITKIDKVDSDLAGLVRLEVEELAAGSFLEGAPVVEVSAVTGQGIDQLKLAIAAQARLVAGKSAAGHLRLPIDRSFSMRGFGTVVTGTLVSGSVSVDQDVEVQPGGRRLRVRGVQVHGEAAPRATAGQRTAVNLAGCDAGELRRGMTLVDPGRLRAARVLDCSLEMLAGAGPVKHGAPVHFHAWASETEAKVRLLSPGYVRLVLRDPVLLLPGDRFILRRFSPVVTIGGGTVIDIDPPTRSRRDVASARVQRLARATPVERIACLVEESSCGLSAGELVARTGLPAKQVLDAAADPRFLYLAQPQPWVVSRRWVESRLERLHAAVAAYHKANPLQPGLPREEFRSRELPGAPAFLADAVFAQSGTVAAEGEVLRLRSHQLHLRQDEEEALTRIESAFERAGLTAPAVGEVLAGCGVEARRARSLLQILLRSRRLVRVSDDLVFHPSAVNALRALLAPRKGQKFSVPEFKEWTGVSRKYAIPLLEFLDREHVTRREGDLRTVLP